MNTLLIFGGTASLVLGLYFADATIQAARDCPTTQLYGYRHPEFGTCWGERRPRHDPAWSK